MMATAPLGAGGIEVTRLGLGCAPFGNLFREISDEAATATVDAAWDVGIRVFDTAPLYGHGLAERRLGQALRAYPRDAYVLSSKVGRVLRPDATFDPGIFRVPRGQAPQADYSADGVRRSLDESLERLGVDQIDIVLVHDPDDHEEQARTEAFPALLALRDEGVIRAVGAGMNQSGMLERFVADLDLDCVLLAGRYSLLDRSGAALLDACATRGIGVLLGGVFNSGVLADGDRAPTFDYAPAAATVVERTTALREACGRHGVPLPAAALRFALDHPAVSAVVVGAASADEIRADAAWATVPIPPDLGAELAAAG
jgi:D-threo-aldose 1-dehydrogenase